MIGFVKNASLLRKLKAKSKVSYQTDGIKNGTLTRACTDLLLQLNFQGMDAEGKKPNKLSSSTQSLGKRHAENIEGALALKRQAVETNIGSPKSLSPSRVSALSREGSFKNLDKGKVRPSPQISLGNHSGNDMPETVRSPTFGPRLQTPKGK